jgi:hypothetical protein
MKGSEHCLVVDLRDFHERARRLAENLIHVKNEEVFLLQDSVTTDIGAGD